MTGTNLRTVYEKIPKVGSRWVERVRRSWTRLGTRLDDAWLLLAYDSTRLDDTRRATTEEKLCAHSGFIKQLYLDRRPSYELKVRVINSRASVREQRVGWSELDNPSGDVYDHTDLLGAMCSMLIIAPEVAITVFLCRVSTRLYVYLFPTTYLVVARNYDTTIHDCIERSSNCKMCRKSVPFYP